MLVLLAQLGCPEKKRKPDQLTDASHEATQHAMLCLYVSSQLAERRRIPIMMNTAPMCECGRQSHNHSAWQNSQLRPSSVL